MSKKLSIFLLALLMLTVVFGTAHAEADLPELTLEELIAWKEANPPEFITEEMVGKVIRGNLYEEYYGITAAAVSEPLRAYMACDRPMFRVGVQSTVTIYPSGGISPYRYSMISYRKTSDDPGTQYSYYTPQRPFRMLSITPDDDYRYLVEGTVYASNGDYAAFAAVYDTVTEASLSNPNTIGGKIQAVIASEIHDGMTDREKALAIHEWLTHNAYYDNSMTIFDPDGVLLKGSGVCQSYARAYQMFMSELGIPAVYITAEKMNHAWNMIYVDGGWYHVDVTWDDPAGDEVPVSGLESTEFFCLTDEEIRQKDHEWDDNGLSSPPSGKGPVYPDSAPEPFFSDVFLGMNELLVPSGGSAVVRFTAPATAGYQFETIGESNTVGTLFADNTDLIAQERSGSYNTNFLISTKLEKGQVVYLAVSYSSSSADSGTETLSISTCDPNGAPSAMLPTLTGRRFPTIPNSGKPKLLFFTQSNSPACEDMLYQLSFLDLSPIDVVIADISGSSLAVCRNYLPQYTKNILGANIGYGANRYMWLLLRSVYPDTADLYVPVLVYISADNQVLDFTSGHLPNVPGKIYQTLGVSLQRADFSDTRLVLPADTQTIGPEAFIGTAAELIEIPASCTSIAANAFNGCPNLKIILNHSNKAITPPAGVVVTDIPLN